MHVNVTNQESAENLKELIKHTYFYVEEMQIAYLIQSMRTIRDYFKGEISINVVRNIELDFFRLCTWNGPEQGIVTDMLDYMDFNMGVKWTKSHEEKPGYWNMTYSLIKGDKKILICATSKCCTEFRVFDFSGIN